jgi:mycothiol synthase
MSVEYLVTLDDHYDREAVVGIGRAIRPDDYVSVEMLKDRDLARRNAGRLNGRWLASVDDSIVGSGYFGESPWFGSDLQFVHVMVHPDHQRRGHGRGLMERAEASACEHGARRLLGHAVETDRRTLRFLTRAGFDEIDREWRSTLDLRSFDPADWEESVDLVSAAGIRLQSVADMRAGRPDWQDELHHLYVDIDRDVPSPLEILEIPREDFEAGSLGRQMLAEGFLVALDGDALVGLTEPQLVDDDPTAISQELTGVRSGYRGRGIATALKAASATWAKAQGYVSIRTYNAQSNAPMLAVNDRLGFVRDLAQIEVLKNL